MDSSNDVYHNCVVAVFWCTSTDRIWRAGGTAREGEQIRENGGAFATGASLLMNLFRGSYNLRHSKKVCGGRSEAYLDQIVRNDKEQMKPSTPVAWQRGLNAKMHW